MARDGRRGEEPLGRAVLFRVGRRMPNASHSTSGALVTLRSLAENQFSLILASHPHFSAGQAIEHSHLINAMKSVRLYILRGKRMFASEPKILRCWFLPTIQQFEGPYV